jgi:hypothetical protein
MKVKEAAQQLLQQVPSSSIVQQYTALVQQSLHIKKEKTLLGLSSKLVLELILPDTIDEAIFKSGIEKLSNNKTFTDSEFIMYQLLKRVPPSVLVKHWQLSPPDIIQLLQKEEANQKWLDALVVAMVKFKDREWAMAFMQHAETFYLDILPFIPLEQQEYYSKKFFKGHERDIIAKALLWPVEWTTDLALLIMAHTANNHYQYYRAFYNQQAHLIPVQVANLLDSINPTDDYAKNSWPGTKEYIQKILLLKQQILQSFI